MATMGRNEGHSFTSSRSTQPIRNPFDNNKCGSQKSNNEICSQTSESSNASSSAKLDFNDFYAALNDFYNLSTGTSGDANTSFSISSYIIKRQKFLHRVTFELKNLVNWDEETKNGTCLGLDATTLLMRGATGNCIVTIPPLISSLLYSVMNVVNSMLLEEVFESQNMSDGYAKGAENETVIAALEFLSTAYGCLECDMIFSSLKEVIDCQGIGADCNSNNGAMAGRKWTIIDAIFHFILCEPVSRQSDKNRSDNFFDKDDEFLFEEERSEKLKDRSKFGSSRTQLLALTALTKAMLNAEYIQRYCSSLTVPPDQGIDSLLGEGLGLRMDERKADLEQIVNEIVSFLTRESDENKNDCHYESRVCDGNIRFQESLPELLSLSFLGVLLRTRCTECIYENIVLKTEMLQRKLVSKSSQLFSLMDHIQEKSDDFIESILSLVLIIDMKQVVPGCISDDISEIVSRTLFDLTSIIVSTSGSGSGFDQYDKIEKNSTIVGGYIHLVTCLTSFHSEVLIRFLHDNVIKVMTKQVIMNFLRDIPDENVWKPQSEMFLMTQFIILNNFYYRKVIHDTLNNDNEVQSQDISSERTMKSYCKLMRRLIKCWSNVSSTSKNLFKSRYHMILNCVFFPSL